MRRMLSFTFVLALAMTAILSAQQSSAGSISGSVTDPSGQVVPGARVKVTFEQDNSERTAVTNEVGDFSFLALQPGRYTVHIEASGFRPYEQKGNVLIAASRLALGQVQLEVGSVSESVVVTAQGGQVATTTSAKSASIDNKQMELIAVKGRVRCRCLKLSRAFRSSPTRTPGAVASNRRCRSSRAELPVKRSIRME